MEKIDNTRNIVIIVENGSLQNLDTHVKVRSLDNHTPRVKYRSCNIAELFIDINSYIITVISKNACFCNLIK